MNLCATEGTLDRPRVDLVVASIANLSAWVLQGYPLKIIKIQAWLQVPTKLEKVPPGSLKDTKNTPKIIPPDIKLLNKWKVEPFKNNCFYCGLTHPAIGFQHDFPWRSPPLPCGGRQCSWVPRPPGPVSVGFSFVFNHLIRNAGSFGAGDRVSWLFPPAFTAS